MMYCMPLLLDKCWRQQEIRPSVTTDKRTGGHKRFWNQGPKPF